MSDQSDPSDADKQPGRRLRPGAAAKYLGVHRRTLEDSRRSWRRAEKEGNAQLRRGPRPSKRGNAGVSYYVSDLDEIKALLVRLSNGLTTEAAAKHIGYGWRTLENWRCLWRRAEAEGKPELRRGPKFYCLGTRVWYEVCDLDEFLASGKVEGKDESS